MRSLSPPVVFHKRTRRPRKNIDFESQYTKIIMMYALPQSQPISRSSLRSTKSTHGKEKAKVNFEIIREKHIKGN